MEMRAAMVYAAGVIPMIALMASLAACTTTSSLPDPLAAGWNGVPVCELLHEDSDQRILRCKFEPGVGHERHFHDPHFGYAIVGGKMQITDDSGVRVVEATSGSSFTSTGVSWHEVINVGETTAVFLIVESK
jgi:quercetin dioxygenase-like cupin family protein